MNLLEQLRSRLMDAVVDLTANPQAAAEQLRPTQDPKFGDYQANCAMSLASEAKRPPREIAQAIVSRLRVEDLCEPIEIAGPGFINFRLKDDTLGEAVLQMLQDARLGVLPVPNPRTVIVDYSSPNVAKPMHVGHIRSTVIGAAIAGMLRYRGHHVITDNHLGDWGTQFGMVIYGYKHFCDEAAYREAPVAELSRLYRLVNHLIGYHKALVDAPTLQKTLASSEHEHEILRQSIKPGDKKGEKNLRASERRLQEQREQLKELQEKVEKVQTDRQLFRLAAEHADIGNAVLRETSRLHAGDEENLQLWRRFMPYCLEEIEKVYKRLKITFDHQLGESFYHDRLGGVVEKLVQDGLATESEGAMCVFLDGFEAPMIVRKQDGAYLYATTDLATLQYRKDRFDPDEILYVVDHRQSEHFEKLFAVAARWGMDDILLRHISFGTVLGPDGKPFKTRSGSSVGLEALLDDAVAEASREVCDPSRLERFDPPMDEVERAQVADIVGHSAIKYFDLVHHRTSDYEFDLKKMVSLDGHTSAYVQYAVARIHSVLRTAEVTEEQVCQSATSSS